MVNSVCLPEFLLSPLGQDLAPSRSVPNSLDDGDAGEPRQASRGRPTGPTVAVLSQEGRRVILVSM